MPVESIDKVGASATACREQNQRPSLGRIKGIAFVTSRPHRRVQDRAGDYWGRQVRSRAVEVGRARADRLVKHPNLDRRSSPATAKNRLGEAMGGERSVRPGLRMGSRTCMLSRPFPSSRISRPACSTSPSCSTRPWSAPAPPPAGYGCSGNGGVGVNDAGGYGGEGKNGGGNKSKGGSGTGHGKAKNNRLYINIPIRGAVW